MIIDTKGNELHAWYRKDGPLIMDADNKYGTEFAIGVEYSDKQKAQFSEIKELKKYLKDTDYRALKYADGAYTEEEYRPYKEARATARARINEIEEGFSEPTLTREEIDEAERLVMEKLKEDTDDNTDDES
ncbi:hypothetical protein [Butyrivibrio sp.]|uniref:hypothetical protein n=1 Tax=Butyrivibrio sp. TaxID=28121 RepID=UPI001B446971|nr:hypothetical protein [Butyrivibrio sp.]MBP3816925.1 hypothetical protein [Butyrivibrio sp.]MBQ9302024.1 hypothetical protein [Butyrivibrio sp.]